MALSGCSSSGGGGTQPDTNKPPTVTFTLNKIAVPTGADVTLTAAADDPDGDPVTIVAVTPAIHGLIKLKANAIRYSPKTSFTGTDTFTYTIGDGKQLSASATVVITVNRASTAHIDAGTVSSATVSGFTWHGNEDDR